MKQFATYLRVSTQKQGKSMLGIEAQRKMCEDFISHNNGSLLQEFIDVESGTHRNRKGLQDAISFCKNNQCPLVIAKLDRLARDVEFCFKVINTGIEIHFTDMPQINTLLLGVFASVAQYERELTSDRTKKALAVKKAQGCKLGARSETYKRNYDMKTEEQKKAIGIKRGQTRNRRKLESRDTQTLIKILQRTFVLEDDINEWKWWEISVGGGMAVKILQSMKDFKDMDDTGRTFAKWDFSDLHSDKLYHKLASAICNLKNSIYYANGKI